jgi:lysozyme
MGVNNLSYSSAALRVLTEDDENCKLTAYWDPWGKCWTIGWGHTGKDVHEGLVISQEEADTLLMCDTMRAQIAVNTYVDVPLTQHQFDALVDFVFNVGSGHFTGSTLLKDLNAGDYKSAELQLTAWVFSGGKKLPGLIHRRALEENWFATADQAA